MSGHGLTAEETAIWADLHQYLTQDATGRDLLSRFEEFPQDSSCALHDWLSLHETQAPPSIVNYISGGQIEKLVNIAQAAVVQIDSGAAYIRAERVEIKQAAPASTKAVAPAPPPCFTGRLKQLEDLRASLIRRDDQSQDAIGRNALALVGMGGVGKTATAQKVAAEMEPCLPGGVFWGKLSDHDGNPRPILREWGRTCGQDLSEISDPTELADQVANILATRRDSAGALLVIVDDVREEWRDSAELLRRTIPSGSPFLMTTRDERMARDLDAECVDLEELPLADAMAQLRAYGGAALVDADLPAAKSLLDALGNLPLAIELAGEKLARFRRKPGYRLKDLLEEVQEQADEALPSPDPERGLMATFAITYNGLSTDLQCLFRTLGAFAGAPLQPTPVASMVGWEDRETEDRLDDLVMVRFIGWGQPTNGHVTYTIHSLVRQFACFRLEHAPDYETAIRSHLRYYRDLAKDCAEQSPPNLRQIETEYPNLQRAFRWAEKLGDDTALCELTLNVQPLFWAQANLRDWNHWLDAALPSATRLNDWPTVGKMQNSLGTLYGHRGELEKAAECFEQSRQTYAKIGDTAGMAKAMSNLALVALNLHQLEQAEKLLNEAKDTAGVDAPLELQRLFLTSLADVHMRQGRPAEAAEEYRRALTIEEKLQSPYDTALIHANLADALIQVDDVDQADIEASRALELAQEHRCAEVESNAQLFRAKLAVKRKQLKEPVQLSFDSLRVAIAHDLDEQTSLNLDFLASLRSSLVAKGDGGAVEFDSRWQEFIAGLDPDARDDLQQRWQMTQQPPLPFPPAGS